ncbi:MAG: hypothetical protein NVS1B4_25860 [Gemmatimonadaceae bacterium]
MKRLLHIVVTAAALATGSSAVAAQETAARLEITGVGDSTFTIQARRHPWVQRGTTGFVIDPKRHESLVARFSVLAVDGGIATAVITGMTTDVKPEHIALIEIPRDPWYRQSTFWGGLALGGLIGAVIRGH